MKKGWKAVALATLTVAIVVSLTGAVFAAGPAWSSSDACTGDESGKSAVRTTAPGNGNGHGSESTGTGAVSSTPLSAEEEEWLLLMREEEKLARDVYTALYEAWDVDEFENIADSESRHMDSVARLIDRYGLTDPVTIDVPGEFVNEELQAAYEDLMEQGLSSIEAAYQVGVAIEELDIDDLKVAIEEATHRDIDRVFSNLLKGSENHLDAFESLLAG